eukprot:Nk52_evm9s249 gene=Nk52_evmTU9s249
MHIEVPEKNCGVLKKTACPLGLQVARWKLEYNSKAIYWLLLLSMFVLIVFVFWFVFMFIFWQGGQENTEKVDRMKFNDESYKSLQQMLIAGGIVNGGVVTARPAKQEMIDNHESMRNRIAMMPQAPHQVWRCSAMCRMDDSGLCLDNSGFEITRFNDLKPESCREEAVRMRQGLKCLPVVGNRSNLLIAGTCGSVVSNASPAPGAESAKVLSRAQSAGMKATGGFKEDGNKEFRRRNYSKAAGMYTLGLEVDEGVNSKLKCALLLVIGDCRAYLGLNPCHMKALGRLAKALMGLQIFVEAIEKLICVKVGKLGDESSVISNFIYPNRHWCLP